MTGPTVLRETVRLIRGRTPLWRLHRERLAEGGVTPAGLDAAEMSVLGVAALGHRDITKLHVIVTSEGRVRVLTSREPSSLEVPGGPALVPVRMTRLPDLPPNAAKPAGRTYWDGPQRLAHLRGGDQAVLVDADDSVIDGGTATVWALVDGVLVTPPAPPAVAGVARRFILRDVAPAVGVPTEVRPLTLVELDSAEEALLSNAVGGLVTVRGRGGAVSQRLERAYREHLGLLGG
jgi:branched-subunit amino acid aminotransferase/4-amino-4-deoxychorismate lyase